MTPVYSVFFGAADWRHPRWAGVFYPEAMPEDWHLAYYSTQFRSVFLPRASWVGQPAEVLAVWAGEVSPGFRFVLEASGDAARDAGAVEALGESLGLLVSRDDPRLVWFSGEDDLRTLTARIRMRSPGEPLYLFSRDPDLEKIEEVATLLEVLGL